MSFPRLRPCAGEIPPEITLSDRDLVQLICAFRIFNHELEISISTRESSELRNHLIPLGVTTMSAGSKQILVVMARMIAWSNLKFRTIDQFRK